ncbi:MAG: RNA polymerase sigma factor RpoD/SigA [Chitinophagaceae bacterium]
MRELKISASITARDSESIGKYLHEISKIEMISPEEEVRLSILVKDGDHAARQRLVNANLRFVVSVAKQFQGQGMSLSDLINEGNIGLVKAAERFDHTRGFKFISFAVWWIRQSILHALAENARMIQIPVNKLLQKKNIDKTQSSLEQELERMPSDEEIAEAMNLEYDEVKRSRSMSNASVSLDAPIAGGEEDTFLLDSIENKNAAPVNEKLDYRESLRKDLARSLSILDKRQKEMICCLYGIGVDYPMTIDDLAMKYNLTRERVRQIKDKAILRLQTGKQSQLLKGYMGRA